MTTQPPDPAYGPPPTPAGSTPPAADRQALPAVAPYRELGALALLGANAALLLFAIISLFSVFVENGGFSGRADGEFGTYVGLVSIFFPLAAVALATFIKPAVPHGRLITTGALIEYGVSAVFGLVCLFAGFILTVGANYSGAIIDAFLTLLARLVWLVLLGFAAFLVGRVFQSLYYVPKPKAAPMPAGYPQGYPQPGYPQGYNPGYGPSGAYPTVQGYPPQQQGYQQPGWGYPQPQQPVYGQQPFSGSGYPGTPSPSAPPVAQPVPPAAPSSAPPAPPPPPGQDSLAAPSDDSPTGIVSSPYPPGPTATPTAAPEPATSAFGREEGAWAPPSSAPPSSAPPSSAPPSSAPPSSVRPAEPAAQAADEETDNTQLISAPKPEEAQQSSAPPAPEHRDQPFAGRPPGPQDEPTQPWS